MFVRHGEDVVTGTVSRGRCSALLTRKANLYYRQNGVDISSPRSHSLKLYYICVCTTRFCIMELKVILLKPYSFRSLPLSLMIGLYAIKETVWYNIKLHLHRIEAITKSKAIMRRFRIEITYRYNWTILEDALCGENNRSFMYCNSIQFSCERALKTHISPLCVSAISARK